MVELSETGICLSCHRSMDFRWRITGDGKKLEVLAPAHEVAREADAQKPDLLWVTLQMRCRCGNVLGIVVDFAPVAQAAPLPA